VIHGINDYMSEFDFRDGLFIQLLLFARLAVVNVVNQT